MLEKTVVLFVTNLIFGSKVVLFVTNSFFGSNDRKL